MTNPAGAKPLSQPLPRELLTRFGESFDEAAGAAREAVERYVATLTTLDERALSRPVAPGGWSPSGFTDHLRKATNIHVSDIRLAMSGGQVTRHQLGSMDEEGRLVVTIPEAEPGPDMDLSLLVAELRAATAELIETVRDALDDGHGGEVVHVNPYFGELTPLGCLQLCAAHAHHHRKRHLDVVKGGQ